MLCLCGSIIYINLTRWIQQVWHPEVGNFPVEYNQFICICCIQMALKKKKKHLQSLFFSKFDNIISDFLKEVGQISKWIYEYHLSREILFDVTFVHIRLDLSCSLRNCRLAGHAFTDGLKSGAKKLLIFLFDMSTVHLEESLANFMFCVECTDFVIFWRDSCSYQSTNE